MREIFDCLDVLMCCSLSVITTLEFFEHHFAKVGHRLAPYDPTLFLHKHRRHLARECVCREAASLCAGHAQQLGGVSPSTQPDGGEGLAKRKGYRREAGSRRSVMQTCESMDKNRV